MWVWVYVYVFVCFEHLYCTVHSKESENERTLCLLENEKSRVLLMAE